MRPVRSSVVAAVVVAGLLSGHGTYVKPLFNAVSVIAGGGASTWQNAKVNAATRGSTAGAATTLYAMDPPLHHSGSFDMIGWRIVTQDEDAATPESFEMQVVSYAANGIDPDPAGVLRSHRFFMFGAGGSGRESREWTIGLNAVFTVPLARHGIGFHVDQAPNWPADGLSIHAQLNLPGHPLRPRVPPPYDQQVWAFETPDGQVRPVPLGGRALDTLLYAPLCLNDPALQGYVVSTAYGNGPELLRGPESMHPAVARGDLLGFEYEGNAASDPVLLLVAPRLASAPLRWPGSFSNNPFVHLDLTPPFPVVLQIGVPDASTGRLTFAPIPWRAFPPALREFWVQALVHHVASRQVLLSDAVGVRGS